MNAEEARASAFARWFDERVCTRIDHWEWGSVLVDAEVPDAMDVNYLSIERLPMSGASAPVIAEAERVRIASGIERRRISVPDTRLADRLMPAFRDAGWSDERHRLMVLRRPAEDARVLPVVDEVSLAAFLRFADDLEVATREAAEPLRARPAYIEKVDRAIGTRCFVVSIDGAPVSGCTLWTHGDDAVLDSVATLPSARGRGAGTAVVLAAADAAARSGATWIHLYTDAEIGPTGLYRRLGFDDVGGVADFYWRGLSRSRSAPRGAWPSSARHPRPRA